MNTNFAANNLKCYYRQRMKAYYYLFTAGSLIATLASCSGDPKPEVNSVQQDTIIQEESMGFGFSDLAQTTYAVPSPNELFSIIKSSKLPFKENLVSTEPVNYTSSMTQALNFGRTTADIAYTASYEKFQESMQNFDNLRNIGNDLGISYVFDEFMVNRVKSNMDNPDSLEIISTGSYQSIISMLEENEKGSTLAIISAGGFVESIYILCNLIEGNESDDIIQRLADQKLVMENVIAYLDMHSEEERVQQVLNDISPISDVYFNLDEEKISEEVTKKGDKNILGGSRVIMSSDELQKLKTASTNYRNSFSNAK
jgi:hypothetical protein